MRYKTYVTEHKSEIKNPPDWVLSKAVTMSMSEACKALKMDRLTLIKSIDDIGFTVMRDNRRSRRFLRSEVKTFLDGVMELNADTIRRATKGDQQNAMESIKENGKRRGRSDR